jgi:hypothetical protein
MSERFTDFARLPPKGGPSLRDTPTRRLKNAQEVALQFPGRPGKLGRLNDRIAIKTEDERRATAGTLSKPLQVQRQEKLRSREAAIPNPVRNAPFRLTLLGQETLAAVYRANKAAGGEATMIARADLAAAVGVTHSQADKLLHELVAMGAVKAIPGFGPGIKPRYRAEV